MSKFGDDLTIVAGTDKLSLCSTNTSMSAYCCFKYDAQFFTRYHVAGGDDPFADAIRVSGQVLVKVNRVFQRCECMLTYPYSQSLLTILKHKTVEKSVDKCELSIVDGVPDEANLDDEEANRDRDTLESKLIVRLYCKHGDSTPLDRALPCVAQELRC